MPKVGADPWSLAVVHLRGADPRLGRVIDRVGPCALRPRRDRFGTLVRAIVGQQISSKAAASINARLLGLEGLARHDPDRLLALGEAGIRSAGLSGVKSRYVLNLSQAVRDGEIPLARIGRLDDESIIERLVRVKGIGRWTAEMFLIFALNRPDVLPVADLGIRVGLRDHHGLGALPGPSECRALAEPWRPFRSVAMWYLWRSLDTPRPAPAAEVDAFEGPEAPP